MTARQLESQAYIGQWCKFASGFICRRSLLILPVQRCLVAASHRHLPDATYAMFRVSRRIAAKLSGSLSFRQRWRSSFIVIEILRVARAARECRSM